MRKWNLLFAVAVFSMLFMSGPAAATEYRPFFLAAGHEFGISPRLLESIAFVESRLNPNAINHNANGSFDVGLMQINSSWYRVLGHERWRALGDPSYNIRVGAWILAQCIQRHGYSWKAVGCYNARSEKKGKLYARKVQRALAAHDHTKSTAN